MYRGRRAVMSWTMTVMLSVASALGVIGVVHAFQTPHAAAAASVTTPSTATTTHPIVYTTYRGDDGASTASAGTTTTHYDN